MRPSDDREAAAVFDFIDEYLGDLEKGRVRALAEYLARHKGFEEAIAREYLALRGHDAAKERVEAREGARDDDERRIGPYRLLRELGRGGQGSVWLAEDVRIARKVALKVLASRFEGVSEDRRKRFRREAEAIAKLEHPGICPIYDADVDCDTPWIAMRYVEGKTLAQLVGEAREAIASGRTQEKLGDDSQASEVTTTWPPRSALDVNRTLLLFERCARALHAAHEAGVIHRDIKPGNLIVTLDGKPVVLDFGLARDESSDTGTITEEGEVFGTPAYMSPEQLASASSELDRRTDVYSLGVALYEALTLKRPFDSNGKAGGRQMLQALMADEPPPDPRATNAALSLDVKVVLETALEKDRTRRYATALELAEDLRRIREYEPIKARPASVGLRFARWMKRHPALAAATIGAIGSLSIGLVASLYSLKKAREANEYALGKHLAQRAVTLTREDPAAALVLGIEAVRKAPNDLTREALVQSLETCRLGGMLFPRQGNLRDMALSADGKHIALACDQFVGDGRSLAQPWDQSGRVELFDAYAHTSSGTLERPRSRALAVAWRPDGSALYVAYETTPDAQSAPRACVVAWDVPTRSPIVERELAFLPERLDASRDGSALLVVGTRGKPSPPEAMRVEGCGGARELALLDGATLAAREPLAALPSCVEDARFAADGSRLAVWSHDDVALYATVDGAMLQTQFESSPFHAIDVDASAPKLRIAIGDHLGRLTILDEDLRAVGGSLELKEPVELVRLRGRRAFVVTEPTSAFRATASARAAHVQVVDLETRIARDVDLKGSGALQDATFSPGGDRIACIGQMNSIHVVDLATTRSEPVLAGFVRPLQCLWSRDGRMLFTRSVGPAAQVWFTEGAPRVPRIALENGNVLAAVLSRDGRRAITWRDGGGIELWDVANERFERVAELSSIAPPPGVVASKETRKLDPVDMRDAVNPFVRSRAFGGFAPDGGWWACGSSLGTDRWRDLRVFGNETRPAISGLLESSRTFADVAHSADGSVHAALLDSGDVFVLMRDGSTTTLEHDRATSAPLSIALDDRGDRLATCMRDGSVRLWSTSDRRELRVLTEPRAKDVPAIAAFRPGTHELAVYGRDYRIRFWNVETGERVRNDALIFEPRSIAYSRDGELLLVTGRTGGGAVRVFTLEPFAPVKFDTFHLSELTAGELSDDGRYVLTASRDGSVFVRESATGLVFARRTFEGREVVDAHFGGPSDDLSVIAVTDDGVVRVWPVDPLPAALARYRRELGDDEKERERKLAAPLEYVAPRD